MRKTQFLAATALAGTIAAGAASAQTEITLWYHGAGNDVEARSDELV